MNNLSDLNAGEFCKIIRLNIKGNIKRRLQDIGLIEGTTVKCELISPLGDPKAYRIRGALIAIRNSDAKYIDIEKTN